MTDCFAVLGVPRRPWLEEDLLKERLHRLTETHHPDLAGGSEERFGEINAACATLSEPRTRLAHLLALESLATGSKPQIPVSLGDLFLDTAGILGRLEAFLEKESRFQSPIAKAALAGEKFALIDAVEAQLGVLVSAEEALLDELRAIDGEWEGRKAELAPRVEKIAHSLAFLAKWIAQFREGFFKLSV